MIGQTDPAINIVEYISRGGFVVMLLVIIYGGMRKWWVFGWQYDECSKREEEWRALALRNQDLASTSTNIGEKLVDRSKP